MLRRVHTPLLHPGEITLDAAASRHARDVLRLDAGTTVEVFDDAGAVAIGTILRCTPLVIVHVDAIDPAIDSSPDSAATAGTTQIIVASAVPKGDRADWMIEKLSELGCNRFIPLAAARSIVLPEGRGKRDRWLRLATESAKQSRRRGVMRIDELTPLAAAVASLSESNGAGLYLSTDPDAVSIVKSNPSPTPASLTLFIGPEGGWTDDELRLFQTNKLLGRKLTDTILRIETAAVAAAAIILTLRAAQQPSDSQSFDSRTSNPQSTP